jgi:hypothetical protein
MSCGKVVYNGTLCLCFIYVLFCHVPIFQTISYIKLTCLASPAALTYFSGWFDYICIIHTTYVHLYIIFRQNAVINQ